MDFLTYLVRDLDIRTLVNMASKKAASAGARRVKKVVAKIDHKPFFRVKIPAGGATPAPPLGPLLGQRSIQIQVFVKDFNEKTKIYKPGIPLVTAVTVNPDRSCQINIMQPETTFFLKQAAGIKKGTFGKDDVAGMVSLKHIYEIAKIKQQDNQDKSLEDLCKSIIGTARTMNIRVVKELKPEEYGEFLKERQNYVEQYEKELEEARQAKLLRL